MHDVDRTLQEGESEFAETELQELSGEGEEFLGDIVGGLLGGELESNEGFLGEEEAFEGFLGEEETGASALSESQPVFDEVTEMELAAELLSAQNEEELEQFLGNILKKAGKFIGNVAKGPVGKVLMPALKSAAKIALPAAGAALGNLVLPGVGGALGSKLASTAGSMFGLEFEGLSPQDREFEAAKRVVRFSATAGNRLARTPTTVPPRTAVKAATVAAAKQHIPGLLRPKVVHNVQRVLRNAQINAARQRAGLSQIPGVGHPTHRPRGTTYGNGPTTISGAVYGGAPTYAGPLYGAGYVVPSVDTPSYVNGTTNGNYYAPSGATRTGRWYRRGRKIVLMGV